MNQTTTRHISWAEMEAHILVRRAAGSYTNDPKEFDRDIEYIIDLVERIKDARKN